MLSKEQIYLMGLREQLRKQKPLTDEKFDDCSYKWRMFLYGKFLRDIYGKVW